MRKYFLPFILLSLMLGDLYAQNRREPVVFALLAGVPMPVEDFGSAEGSNPGFAKLGAGGTFEFSVLIYSPGVAWITSTSYFYNPVKEEELRNSLIGETEGFSSGSWNNINLLTGLKIYGPLFGSELIFTFQAGVNFSTPPEITLPSSIANTSVSYDRTTSFAYSLGAGFNFSGFLIGARYMRLGEPELKAVSRVEGVRAQVSSAMPITAAFIYVGFNL